MQRNRFIDALKGLAIILVVIGHAIPEAAAVSHGGRGLLEVFPQLWVPLRVARNPVFEAIYSFQMPLFAFLSGFVLWRPKPLEPKTFVRKRVSGLVVPYFAWFGVFFLVATLFGSPYPQGFVRSLVSVATHSPSSGGLWYLYALFVSSMLLLAMVRTRWSRWLLPASALLVAAVQTLPAVSDTTLLGSVVVSLTYPYVVLGYMVASNADVLPRLKGRLALGGALGFALVFSLMSPVDVPGTNLISRFVAGLGGRMPLRIASTQVLLYGGAVCAIAALVGIYHFGSGRFVSAQAWLGRRTLGIYAMHGLASRAGVLAGVHNWILLTAISLALSLAATLVLERMGVLSQVFLGASARVSAAPPRPPRLDDAPENEKELSVG